MSNCMLTMSSGKDDNLPLSIIENISDAVIITDPNSTILYVNKQFTALTGYQKSEVIGQKPSILKSGIQDDAFYEEMWSTLLNTGEWSSHLWNKRKNGKLYLEFQTITAYHNNIGELTHYIATFQDCTEELNKDRQKTYQESYDNLTFLPNKKRLYEFVEKKVKEFDDFSVIVFHAAHLSRINRNFGLDTGDQFLQIIAGRLSQLGAVKGFLARTGGDKFVVVTSYALQGQGTGKVISNIIDDVEKPMSIKEECILPFIEVGISHFPQHGTSARKIIENAEIALYNRSKQSSYSLYEVQVSQNDDEDFILAQKIKSALKNQSFEVHYQPQYDTKNKKVIGAEALIRWHKDGRYLPPNIFLTVAEKYYLIESIDMYVFKKVFADIEQAKKTGIKLPKISINLAETLIPIATLVALMNRYSVNGDDFEVELTEGVTSQESGIFAKYIKQLKELRVSTAIDDFGTGFSSLARLKALPFDKLKIDKQFVDDVVECPKERRVLEAIVDIGNVLNKTIIIEGVENAAQVSVLQKLNCNLIQGYFFSKAIPLHELIELYDHQVVYIA